MQAHCVNKKGMEYPDADTQKQGTREDVGRDGEVRPQLKGHI